MVRRAAPAEHDPLVGGALAVDDQVPEVGERRAVVPGRSHPRPPQAAARSPRSASRPGRRARFMPSRSGVKPSVARTTCAALTVPCGSEHPTRLDRRHLGLLVDRDSARLDDPGQAADELGRVDPGAVRRVGRTEHVGGRAHRGRLGGVQQPDVVLGVAPGCARPSTSCLARSSWVSVRAKTSVPPRWRSQSMPSAATTRSTSATVCRISAIIALAAARDEPGSLASLSRDLREQRRAPAAVAAGGAEAGDVLLEHGDPQATGRARSGSRRSRARSGRRRRSPRRRRCRRAEPDGASRSSPQDSCHHERDS